jgi:hypothetical protein
MTNSTSMSKRTYAAGMAPWGRLLAGFALGAGLSLCAADGALAPKIACAEMNARPIPASAIALPTGGGKLTAAVLNPAANGNPEYCDVSGSILPVDPKAPEIHFRISVPAAWNQKTWHVGGGGTNGVVPMTGTARASAAPGGTPTLVAQGFAVFGGDSGHQSTGFGMGAPKASEYDWVTNQESWLNFSYQQLKKTHDAAAWVLQTMYGAKAQYSYFGGSSQGGREGLEVVSRYPQDYDGVYVTVPLAYFAGLLFDPSVKGVDQLAAGHWLPPAKAGIIRDEIVRLCDGLDGLSDGVINNYKACFARVDSTLAKEPFAALRCAGGQDTGGTCLSDGQLATLRSFYAPANYGFALANGEKDWPGWGVGLEAGGSMMGGWLTVAKQPDSKDPSNFNAGIGQGVQKALLGGSQDFNLLTFDFARFQKQLQMASDTLDVREDWSAFFRKGGKLIMVSGASDYISNPRAQMRLIDRVTAKGGKAAVEKSVRYYVMPNAGHGLSGSSAKGVELAGNWDAAAALTAWVEKGSAPGDAITLTRYDRRGAQQPGSRLMCQYPQYPKYKGSGEETAAGSFVCAE